MANPKHKLDREEIMSFLLGEMDDAETSNVEAMFLAYPTYSSALEEAKSELFEAYKSGRLSPRQSGVFEQRYLPDLEEDKREFQAMLERNEEERSKPSSSAPVAPSSKAPSSKASSSKASSSKAPSSKASSSAVEVPQSKSGNLIKIAAVLILAIAGVGIALAMRGDKAEAPAQSVTLSIFSERGHSQVIVLPDTSTVILQLPLPSDLASETFSIKAFQGDTEASWPAERVGNLVTTKVQKSKLGAGRYDLELRNAKDDSVIGYYSFRK